jgi:DNA-binding MarR family transcriptional regulator
MSASNYTYTEQVGHLLRKAYQRHMAIFQQNVGESQLTAVQFITLCAVRDHGPSALSELVKMTAVDQATIRGIVERLKARDLIVLGHDAQDRRKVIVSLSEAGRRALRRSHQRADPEQPQCRRARGHDVPAAQNAGRPPG